MTAVEWLANEITNRITRRNPHDVIVIQTLGKRLIELIEQAQEMEKQQIMNAWLIDGYTDITDDNWKSEFNEYYNKIFKNTEK